MRSLLLAAAVMLTPVCALAETAATPAPWSAGTSVADEVRAGKPLVVLVVVPLCSNAQINCGSGIAGRAGDLRTNLYWGAIFGARRFFDRPNSGWEQVSVEAGDDAVLERVVYRRKVKGTAWGMEAKQIEQLVVLEAIHGDKIDAAIARLGDVAMGGARVKFRDGEHNREAKVQVVGYAGHNRMMDGAKLPEPPTRHDAAIPSFVLACYSDSYFAAPLQAAGSTPLLTTRALMAQEGYAIDATVRALGDNRSKKDLRDDVVRNYAKWQRLEWNVASSMFALAR